MSRPIPHSDSVPDPQENGGAARVMLGFWSFFVPMLADKGIKPVAALLALFLIVSGVVGYFFMPDTSGKSLEQIETERALA